MTRFIAPLRTLRARRVLFVGVAGAIASLALGVPAAGAADPGFDTVVSGLGNPRGMAFSADGKLYVAEGGDGGSVCFEGEGCAGLTAKITKVDVGAGSKSDFITGLLSLAEEPESGFFTVGATGVAVQGNQVFGLMAGNPIAVPPLEACAGPNDTPACRAVIAAAAHLGGVLRAVPSGGYDWKQNVGRFNYDWTVANNGTIPLPGWKSCSTYPTADPCNPDFNPGDANPYSIASAPGGNYVVDGGANTLTWVPQNGTPTVLAALPNPAGPDPYDAVPTCVAPVNGKVVIGDLSGRIFVYDGSTMFPTPQILGGTGFLASVGGCAADGQGNVYITDIFVGNVMKLSLQDMSLTPVSSDLSTPTGVAIAKDGSVYVSNNGVCPSFLTEPAPPFCSGSGSVVKLHTDSSRHGKKK